ncbi:PDZ domain-containing protein 11 isoform X1 [Hoplias malabaricus]|uniref:PDZ domain-containing protein 11 isoform X1 n=2 Tax=Hoplias malabaricus TaxID=27720 RepID=UPI003461C1EE
MDVPVCCSRWRCIDCGGTNPLHEKERKSELRAGTTRMDQKIPYDDYQLPVVFLPPYENPPAWIPPQDRINHPDYNNELTQFLPRAIVLKKPPGAQLGFNIRGGKASQLGIFISKVVPDSDAHRAGLQEGDQVLSVNEVDFQDIEHSRAVEILKTAREIVMRVRYFPYNYQRQKERTVH